jgi:hypothetical protein
MQQSATSATPSFNTEAAPPSPEPPSPEPRSSEPGSANAEVDLAKSDADVSARRGASNCSTCSNPTPAQKGHDQRQVICLKVLPSTAPPAQADFPGRLNL